VIANELNGDEARPLISVMLPVYEPESFLLETLRTVLDERKHFAPEQMQVTIVDDCSSRVDVRALLQPLIGVHEIEICRNTETLGLAGNWNRCIELARGTFVHLLHQDDLVRPEFYSRLLTGFERTSSVGMTFCRHGFIDRDGSLTDVSRREKLSPGVLRDWLPKIARETRIQTPAAIVRRSVYEQLGGFRTDLEYALDWEMWARIAVHHDVWYEPTVLAHYRRHEGSETARLQGTGNDDSDVLRAIEVIGTELPSRERESLVESAYAAFARRRIKRARKLLVRRQFSSAHATLRRSEEALLRVSNGVQRWIYERQVKRLMREAELGVHAHA